MRVLLMSVALSACTVLVDAPQDSGTPNLVDAGQLPPSGDAGAPLDAGDAASHGGTITFGTIGSSGWYPTRADPAGGNCDAYQANGCCLAKKNVAGNLLTPWDEDLIVTLRGPMEVKQLAVYQPAASGWARVSQWTEQAQTGVAFDGNGAEHGFPGTVGSECLVNVSTDRAFACGSGSSPFCTNPRAFEGWSGSKLFVLLARMPHVGDVPGRCSTNDTGNWFDAPWIGLSLGELIRAGAFGSCQCYARSPAEWWLGDGCGQFNAFEVVNDQNQFRNLSVFSTNFFGYGGYVGEGPCGPACDVSGLGPEVDLIDKQSHLEAARGAISSPGMGPRAAFRRPVEGYRYFLMLFDVPTRTVQLALVHPAAVPAGLTGLLPAVPETVEANTIDAVRELRLPH